VLKVVLVKLPRAKKGEDRKEKRLSGEKGYLGKYSSREKCKRIESEREMGLVVDQDQGLTSYAPSTCRSRSKSGSNYPSKKQTLSTSSGLSFNLRPMITHQGPDFPRRSLPFRTCFGPSSPSRVSYRDFETAEKKNACVTFVRGTAEFGSSALVLLIFLMIMIF
jgi:hypothetical protein